MLPDNLGVTYRFIMETFVMGCHLKKILGNKLGNNKILRNNLGHRHNLGIGQQAGSETKYSVTRLGTDRIQGNKMRAQPEYWVRSWGHV